MVLRLAFAVNKDNVFEKKHFGDADKYLIFESNRNRLFLVDEMINVYKDFDEKKQGSIKKGVSISKYLVKNRVNVIVSQQFAKNISEVNKYFIPVVIYFETVKNVVSALNSKLNRIIEEVNRETENHKLFKIKSGILKENID